MGGSKAPSDMPYDVGFRTALLPMSWLYLEVATHQSFSVS